jgi:hypothetical protein
MRHRAINVVEAALLNPGILRAFLYSLFVLSVSLQRLLQAVAGHTEGHFSPSGSMVGSDGSRGLGE